MTIPKEHQALRSGALYWLGASKPSRFCSCERPTLQGIASNILPMCSTCGKLRERESSSGSPRLITFAPGGPTSGRVKQVLLVLPGPVHQTGSTPIRKLPRKLLNTLARAVGMKDAPAPEIFVAFTGGGATVKLTSKQKRNPRSTR